MNFSTAIFENLINIPLLFFLFGFLFSLIQPRVRLPSGVTKIVTLFILFAIGVKGGGPLIEKSLSSLQLFSNTIAPLIGWGLLSPLLSFYLIRSSNRVDPMTAAAIAASFGSVSAITFITAISFLDQLQVSYHEFIIPALTVMEVPAIVSGIFIGKMFKKKGASGDLPPFKTLAHALFNKVILSIILGLILGALFQSNGLKLINTTLLFFFKPLLCLFLFDLGISVGLQRGQFASLSWSVNLFGLYMPLIGGSFGLLLSSLLGLDVGTGTLVAVLTGSASYIAVPAAMRIALPEAKEAVYLPLSLGIAFPFNVIIGIPLYYSMANLLLS